jgi:N-carbamoyl-L-amino-acid hydrolase
MSPRWEPSAPNVIPGRVTVSLEIRDVEMATIDALFERMREAAATIGTGSGTQFSFTQIYRTEPASAAARVQDVIEATARNLGHSTLRVPSGAGHDAQEIAQLAPMGMIFIPSRNGISHSAEEYSAPEWIENGANVLLHTLIALDRAL